ncbi:MAG TPA: hypothetical protein VNS29_04170 [Burkholderiaceae bacterium]|nr:hypothetical protein [Burkholderiaceae bacterium]
MSAELPRWAMRDPARVYERIEAMEQAQAARTPEAKARRAKEQMNDLFKEPPRDSDNK